MAEQPGNSEDKSLRLRSASRNDDGFFSTFLLRKISRNITRLLVETPIKPNHVTSISLIVGVFAAHFAGQGNYLVGALLLHSSLILDCIDGEIARYKNEFSPLGAWLDALTDRFKEFLYIGALIYSTENAKLWWGGIAIVILQTTRHLSDYNFSRIQKSYEINISTVNRTGLIYWAKKIIHLPIGERWLLLAVLPLTLSIEISLRIFVYLGFLSFLYVLLTRIRRIRKWENRTIDDSFITLQRDTFLNLKITGKHYTWLAPSILRGLEFFALLLMPVDISALTRFLLISAIALWHYTNLYDSLQGKQPFLIDWGLHFAGRIMLLLIAQISGLNTEIALYLSSYLILLILIRGGHNVARGKIE